MQNLPNTWTIFFPFPVGAVFRVDGPNRGGQGRVRQNAGGVLEFEVRMHAADLFDVCIPELDLVIEAHYRQEGGGNSLVVRVDGLVFEDGDAVVDSTEEAFTRSIRSSVRLGDAPLHIVLSRREGDRIGLVVNGQDFTLERVA